MRKILVTGLACALVCAFADASMAAKKKSRRGGGGGAGAEMQFQRALTRLDPQTRLEQVCDREAMKRIKLEKKLPVDRAQGAASAEPKTDGHKLTATGGAFRTKGGWYELSFVCQATADHMKVVSFEYQTGKAIPEAKWEGYGLWR